MFEFLANNQLISMLRAHEYEDEGFMFHFNSEEFRTLDTRQDKSMPPLITVFSAPNYCDSYGNMVRYFLQQRILLLAYLLRLMILIDGQAGYLVFRNDPFSWKTQQVKTVGHPAPPIASSERGRICGAYLTKHCRSYQPARSFSRKCCGCRMDRRQTRMP